MHPVGDNNSGRSTPISIEEIEIPAIENQENYENNIVNNRTIHHYDNHPVEVERVQNPFQEVANNRQVEEILNSLRNTFSQPLTNRIFELISMPVGLYIQQASLNILNNHSRQSTQNNPYNEQITSSQRMQAELLLTCGLFIFIYGARQASSFIRNIININNLNADDDNEITNFIGDLVNAITADVALLNLMSRR